MKTTPLALCALGALLIPGVGLASGPAQTGARAIRRVDFQNFAYRPACTDSEIRARAGTYSRDEGDDKVSFEVWKRVAYGDLTGDGNEEAVVVSNCNTGGTGNFTEGYVFTMRGGSAVSVGELAMGDRADGGIHTVDVRDGLLVVNRYGVGPSGGACCPEFVESTTYRLSGAKLAQVGATRRQDWVDGLNEGGKGTHRVRFPRGAVSTSVHGMTDGEAKFLLGARAGQTMTVHVYSRDGEAPLVVTGPGGERLASVDDGGTWSGPLPKTGDYTIAVRGTAPNGIFYTFDVGVK